MLSESSHLLTDTFSFIQRNSFNNSKQPEDGAGWQSACLVCRKPWIQSQNQINPVWWCILVISGEKPRRVSRIQSSKPFSVIQTVQGQHSYTRPYLKEREKKGWRGEGGREGEGEEEMVLERETGQEPWLLSQGTWVQFPSSSWWLTAISNSSSRLSDTLFWPFQAPVTNLVQTYTQGNHSHT